MHEVMKRRSFLWGLAATPFAIACSRALGDEPPAAPASWPGPERPVSRVTSPPPPVGDRLRLSDAEWRRRLTREQYRVLREQGTERAFSGDLWDEHRPGTYCCAGCGAPLFASGDKFESGTGWPSFTRPLAAGRVAETVDRSLGMARREVHCARCEGHLGHVFEDGPEPTGLRYCMNGVALELVPS
jgi:peptide-methionine (R)-S-oxide reductase